VVAGLDPRARRGFQSGLQDLKNRTRFRARNIPLRFVEPFVLPENPLVQSSHYLEVGDEVFNPLVGFLGDETSLLDTRAMGPHNLFERLSDFVHWKVAATLEAPSELYLARCGNDSDVFTELVQESLRRHRFPAPAPEYVGTDET